MVNKKTLALFLIFLAGFIVRFYNYPQRINFSAEQGLALGTSADYVKEKFTLLGQRTFLRTTSKGHILFSGALYNYSLIPLQLIFDYDPFPITIVYTLLNIFTAAVLFFLVKKVFNSTVAFYSLILFLLNAEMVSRSMYFWILHTIPLISILSLYLIWKLKKTGSDSATLMLGILGGIAFTLEYFYFFTIVLVLIFAIIFSMKKVQHSLLYVLGTAIGAYTMIAFDMRNNFYHTMTLWQYFLDTIAGNQESYLKGYHFLQFWPPAIILIAYLLDKVSSINKMLVIVFIALYILINLNSKQISFNSAVGMSRGLTYSIVLEAAKSIGDDNPHNFNIVDLPDNDFRAYRFRYLVKNLSDKKPAGVEEYTNISTLYVFGDRNFNLARQQPWEIDTFGATKIETLATLKNGYFVYKLTK